MKNPNITYIYEMGVIGAFELGALLQKIQTANVPLWEEYHYDYIEQN